MGLPHQCSADWAREPPADWARELQAEGFRIGTGGSPDDCLLPVKVGMMVCYPDPE